MLVHELIGGPVDTCSVDTAVTEAARKMLAYDIGSLAVTRSEKLVGIITERDLLRVVADRPSRHRLTVGDVMTPTPDSLDPDVDIDDAADWMMAAGYRHLPVVESGRVLGMVSIKDVLWALTERRPPRMKEWA